MRRSASGDNELVDIEMQLHAETDKAIRVSDDGEEEHATWLPRSQIEFVQKRKGSGILIVTLPTWLAKQRGLI